MRMEDIERYHQILGIEHPSNITAVRKAWRTKSRENHPDLHPNEFEKYNDLLREINEAKEKLEEHYRITTQTANQSRTTGSTTSGSNTQGPRPTPPRNTSANTESSNNQPGSGGSPPTRGFTSSSNQGGTGGPRSTPVGRPTRPIGRRLGLGIAAAGLGIIGTIGLLNHFGGSRRQEESGTTQQRRIGSSQLQPRRVVRLEPAKQFLDKEEENLKTMVNSAIQRYNEEIIGKKAESVETADAERTINGISFFASRAAGKDDPAYQSSLLNALAHRNARVRLEVVNNLGKMDSPMFKTVLETAMKDPDKGVSSAATSFIRKGK